MNKTELKITADNSHTLFVKALNETYHSTNGAIQESKHIFIEAGLRYFNNSKLNVLEIGFGTGLNAFLTLLEASKQKIDINYIAIEAFPLEEKIIQQLNYVNVLNSNAEETKWFFRLHKVEWERKQKITDNFILNKVKIELDQFEATEQFNVIYFDAFGPQVQPEMWTKPIFENMYSCLSKNGVLVTYCAKGSVKRTLKAVGFKLEALPGPPGKREITRAIKL
ncbi:MAG: SAM-dependent methyltransferase [Flavobacteriales bacterium]|nr:MAG: SAM-dependent methyltransferase [Flavobacteriales bacterium]